MTDKELLAKAISFDGGHEVVINNWIHNPEFDDGLHRHYTIDFGGKVWAIRSGRSVLSKKTDEFEYDPMPSSRTDEHLQETRFTTSQEAFEYLEEWKKRTLIRAKAEGLLIWHPDPKKRVKMV